MVYDAAVYYCLHLTVKGKFGRSPIFTEEIKLWNVYPQFIQASHLHEVE